MNIYSIKNEKLEFFNRPIYCESDHEALVYIQNVLMSDADRALSSLKDDLALYKLGEIDFVTGTIYPCLDEIGCAPVFVCSLKEIFDTIPEERLKPALTHEDLKAIRFKLDCLDQRIDNVKSSFFEDLDIILADYKRKKTKKGKR